MKLLKLLPLLLFTSTGFAQQSNSFNYLADLEYLRDTLPAKHTNLFAKISKEQFNTAINKIEIKANSLTYPSFSTELLKLKVAIGDEHTNIEPNFQQLFPIKFDIFEEGIFVTKTTADNASFLVSELIAINGKPIKAVIDDFREIIQYSNRSFFESRLLHFLNKPLILNGLGLIDTPTVLPITLKNKNGTISNHTIKAISQTANPHQATASGYQKPISNTKTGNYWFTTLSEQNTVYVNYNRCQEDPTYPFINFNNDLFKVIEKKKPTKIILDLRYNSGGNSAILKPFIEKIKSSYLNKKGKLYLLIGRDTFSSALMNAVTLKRTTKAILVGQATSGNINHYGEVRGFALPSTKIIIAYSTRYWETWKGKKGALHPDKSITYSVKNYENGIDEALEYIFGKG
ncbi:S41 family peptidase [Pedobacter sp. UBA4863]|uniref:S41 family peptidase n=1 Tax=Pedobacter sp. UBA4863 TaxID=1947060 RepID=UPI0025D6DB02|nr:S41 family peptidase [Pedobacter sp. UBA4863]